MHDSRSRLKDEVDRIVVRTAGALPTRLQRLLGGSARSVDGLTLHPEVQLALRLMALDRRPSFETLPVPEARDELVRESRLFAGSSIALPVARDQVIPTAEGDIAGRLYQPERAHHSGGLLVYFHGGGWVLGDLETHDNTCRFLAKHAKTSVLAVDYRRAPEHPFPAAVNDAVAALHFATEHAEEFGARPESVAVGGDSAGGNLAAVVAQLGTAAGIRPAFQLLFYPVTDLSKKHLSYKLFSSGFFLTEAQMDWYRGHYLQHEADAMDPRTSPLLALDLKGMPPAYVATAGFDPLRDEGEQYAERLREAGVAVITRRHQGLVHGFVNALGVGRTGRAATYEGAVTLRAALAVSGY